MNLFIIKFVNEVYVEATYHCWAKTSQSALRKFGNAHPACLVLDYDIA